MNRFACLLAVLLMANSALLAQDADLLSHFEAKRHIEGNDTLPYLLYCSSKAEFSEDALPLVVFLHGAGERGNNNTDQLRHCIRFFLDDSVSTRYPFLLMAPQCPAEQRWVNTDWRLLEHEMEAEPTAQLQAVFTVIDSLIASGSADPSRVYISGISMGGFGVWDAIQRHPEKFAAAIAICGGGDPHYAEEIKAMPIYIFHGQRDKLVKPSRSQQMYDALQDVGNMETVYVTYPDQGHLCWDRAFSTPGLFKWLFSKKKD